MTQREAEDLTQQVWQLIKTVCNSEALSDFKVKREQLDLLIESIKQFESKNIAVPEDLPKLRESLTEEMEKAKVEQDVLSFLGQQISQMLAAIDTKVGQRKPEVEG
jgi:predicted helicase